MVQILLHIPIIAILNMKAPTDINTLWVAVAISRADDNAVRAIVTAIDQRQFFIFQCFFFVFKIFCIHY